MRWQMQKRTALLVCPFQRHCLEDTERSKLKRRSRLPYPTMFGISSLWPEWEHYDAPATRISFMTHAARAIISIFLPSNGEDDFLWWLAIISPCNSQNMSTYPSCLACKPIPVFNLDAAAMQSVKSTLLQCLLFAAVNVAFTSSRPPPQGRINLGRN